METIVPGAEGLASVPGLLAFAPASLGRTGQRRVPGLVGLERGRQTGGRSEEGGSFSSMCGFEGLDFFFLLLDV